MPSELLAPAIWTIGASHPVLEHLLVIGPYPTVDFFRTFVKRFHPRNVTLVADEGCNKDVLASIRQYLRGENIVPAVRFAWCEGIVHAKIYLLQWTSPLKASAWKLVWGSLNASANGFHKNAET